MRLIVLIAASLSCLSVTLAAQETETAPPPLARTARLRGTVLSAVDGIPIANAIITLVGLDTSVTTGSTGKFDFGRVEPGPYIVQARSLSYEPYTVRAELADSSSLDLVFRMRLVAIRLGDQIVTAKPRVSRFAERMAESTGAGKFITREQIEERHTPFVCDLLRGQAGLRISAANTSGCSIRVARAQGLSIQSFDCAPSFFLDGVRLDISIAEGNNVPTSTIEGIEVYRGGVDVPSEFSGFSACGAIAIWTRR